LTATLRTVVMPADRRRRCVLCAGAALPWISAVGVADARAQGADEPLARIDDLRPLLAAVARERRPLLLFFSTPGCPFCRAVRRGYLRPRAVDGPALSGIVIREVEITSGRRLRDRDGQWLTESELASRYDVRMVPHLELVDARSERLVKPLIGLDSASFYESFLQSAIAEATDRLGR